MFREEPYLPEAEITRDESSISNATEMRVSSYFVIGWTGLLGLIGMKPRVSHRRIAMRANSDESIVGTGSRCVAEYIAGKRSFRST